MQKIFAIIRKDLILRFSTPAEWLFFLILPIVFTYMLAGGTPGSDGDIRRLLPVVDEADTSLSQQIVAELEKSTFVRPELTSRAEAERKFGERTIAFWLLIPPETSQENLLNGGINLEFHTQPNNLDALSAQRSIQAALRQVSLNINAAKVAVEQAESRKPFASAEERNAYFEGALRLAQRLQEQTPDRLEITRAKTADPVQYDPRANSSAGQMITWVFIPLFGISALLAYERNSGTLARLMTTPTSAAVFLLGTIGGQVLMALVQMLLLIGFAVLALGVPWGREPLGLAILLVSGALAAAAIGTAMGTLLRSEAQANNLSIMLGMVMALLGGCWYPLELFPAAAQTIVKVLPTTWAMLGMTDLLLRGESWQGILPEAGVLLGFAALFFTIGILRFRKQFF
ncbi:MAG: ABC transporter permease [Chloroflexota bacterium]|nr:MAG: permease [Bellilinea sp.]